LRKRPGVGTAALEFLILTASRTAEVLKAQWSEVDFDAGVWIRPPSHMKAKVEHSVPLTGRMVEILKGLPRGGAADLIFTGKTGEALGKNSMPKLLKGAGITIHGFRSSFKDWASERTSYPRELVEMSLAHSIGNAVEQAYARSKLVEKRRRLMLEWEKFVATPAVGGDVVPIGKGKASSA
jgi:integrase